MEKKKTKKKINSSTFLLMITNWNGLDKLSYKTLASNFVFLDNYKQILGTSEFWKVLGHTCYYIVLYIPMVLIMSLLIASILNKNMKGINFIRTIYYIPSLIGGSIGIASYPKDTDNLEQLIVCADDAMYKVKKNGKNDFAYYEKPTEE